MNDNPLVSVIIPTYKRSECICNTIDSVLNQTYSNIEIIVVDDNGRATEEQLRTEEKLKKYIDGNQILYVVHDINKNGSAARNTGVKLSRGVYLNFLDDDDVFYPYKIEKQVQVLKNSINDYGAVYCNSRIIRSQKITNRTISYDTSYSSFGNLCKDYLLDNIRFNTSTILFKKSVVCELNGFDESFYRHQDYEFLVRFFMKNNILCAGADPLSEYDTTKVRTYYSNSKKDYEIKMKFLSTFREYFVQCNMLLDVEHHFWYDCMLNCLFSCDYKLFLKAGRKSFSAKCFSIKEMLQIVKCFFVGIIIK